MPDEMTRHLAGLVARRRQIVEMIAAEGQCARRMSDQRLIKSIARLRKALEKELSELDVLIGDQIPSGPSRFSSRRGKDNRPDSDRRTAGTWFARPPTDRGTCRPRAPPCRARGGVALSRFAHPLFVLY